jgi:ABC-2 type transport system ATP-binding protein
MTVVSDAPAIRTAGLGRQYRGRWALEDCTLDIPAGRVVGLVGPNGAGKSTLLNLVMGLLAPSAGTVEVLGDRPGAGPRELARVGFVAQDAPVYAHLTVADHLRFGAHLNPGWDHAYARRRVEELGLDPARKAGRLSGGQRAQLALTLAVAKRGDLLVLDEPAASLDPLARRELLESLSEAVADRAMTVVLSSHLVSDLEHACDHLVLLNAGRVQLAGDIDALLAEHRAVTGNREADLEELVLTHLGRTTKETVK